MPYPSKISYDEIVNKAWELVEVEGFDQLSLAQLAKALSVRAPSLYNHIRNKGELLRAVNERTHAMLFTALNAVPPPQDDALEYLVAVAIAYRDFALTYPITYTLSFATIEPAHRPDAELQTQDAAALQAVMARLCGEADSLAALRGLLALMHGYVMLEIHGQLRRGGDLAATFETVIRVYLRGWSGGG